MRLQMKMPENPVKPQMKLVGPEEKINIKTRT